MTSIHPILLNANSTTPMDSTSSTGSTTSGSSSSSSTANNVLGPDAFITLLTAQLQAQDPLDPLDPNQMVDELTSMNTLQEVIQMRQDLDALAGALTSSQGGGASSNAIANTAQAAAATAQSANSGTSAQSAALNALTSLLPSISRSPAANSVAALYSRLNSQTQPF